MYGLLTFGLYKQAEITIANPLYLASVRRGECKFRSAGLLLVVGRWHNNGLSGEGGENGERQHGLRESMRTVFYY